MSRLTLPLFLLAAACGGKDKDPVDDTDSTSPDGDADTDADSDADSDTDTDTDTDCTASIDTITPEDGDELVTLDEVVVVTFDAAIAAGAPYSVTVSGAPGQADLATDGLSVTFTPDDPFDPETAYTVEASVCGGAAVTSDFVTLPPPVDLADVLGTTFGVAWEDVNITEPAAGAVLRGLLPIDDILLQINSVDALGNAASIATIAYDDAFGTPVPECSVAIREEADFAYNPLYQFGGTLSIVFDPVSGAAMDVEAFDFVGRVAADGSAIEQVSITGLVDPSQILGPTGDCNSLTVQLLLNPTCAPCGVAASGSCMVIEMDAVSAPAIPYFDLGAQCP